MAHGDRIVSKSHPKGDGRRLTLSPLATTFKVSLMAISKIQIGQLWKKNDTGDVYLVTRVYSEALSTVATLRKSGSEGEALIRVKVERTSDGQSIAGFSPAQEDGF